MISVTVNHPISVYTYDPSQFFVTFENEGEESSMNPDCVFGTRNTHTIRLVGQFGDTIKKLEIDGLSFFASNGQEAVFVKPE